SGSGRSPKAPASRPARSWSSRRYAPRSRSSSVNSTGPRTPPSAPPGVSSYGMPQPVLRTDRLLLVPLADRHLELEVQLDSDPAVLRYLSGRARSRDEVLASHSQRMASAHKVDGLGCWMAFGSVEG